MRFLFSLDLLLSNLCWCLEAPPSFWFCTNRPTVDTPSTNLVLKRTLALLNIPSFSDTTINFKGLEIVSHVKKDVCRWQNWENRHNKPNKWYIPLPPVYRLSLFQQTSLQTEGEIFSLEPFLMHLWFSGIMSPSGPTITREKQICPRFHYGTKEHSVQRI